MEDRLRLRKLVSLRELFLLFRVFLELPERFSRVLDLLRVSVQALDHVLDEVVSLVVLPTSLVRTLHRKQRFLRLQRVLPDLQLVLLGVIRHLLLV